MTTIIRDFAVLAGLGLVSYGMWQIYPPLAWVTGGLLLVLAAIIATPRGSK